MRTEDRGRREGGGMKGVRREKKEEKHEEGREKGEREEGVKRCGF